MRSDRSGQRQPTRPRSDPRPPSTPALPPRSPTRPPPPPPGPASARPGPALTHLQAQGRPAGAQELADVAQALALVPRLRVDLQHTAALSGPDASSAPLPRGCTNLRPCPHPEARLGPEVTSSNRGPFPRRLRLRLRLSPPRPRFSPVCALLLPLPAPLTTRSVSFGPCSGIVRTRLLRRRRPSTRTPLPGLAQALPPADLGSSPCSGLPSPPPDRPSAGRTSLIMHRTLPLLPEEIGENFPSFSPRFLQSAVTIA